MILSIVTMLLSWIWWPTFVINWAGMAMFQIFWCCRNGFGTLYATIAVALFCCLAHLGVGLYALLAFANKEDCEEFSLYSYDYSYDIEIPDDFWPVTEQSWRYGYDDRCNEKVWATIAFICGILWAAVAFCVFYFVKSGRHAKWEKMYSNEKTEGNGTNNPVVDLEMVETPPQLERDVEAAPEPEPVVEAAPEPEPAVEAAPEPEPGVEAAPEPEPDVEAAPEPEPSPESEGSAVDKADAVPETEKTEEV
jgi:hypothetical protein